MSSWKPILECIESRFDAYLEAENKPHRTNIIDNRIHACIYFIQPTGHSLKPLDIEFMRRLHSKVCPFPFSPALSRIGDPFRLLQSARCKGLAAVSFLKCPLSYSL